MRKRGGLFKLDIILYFTKVKLEKEMNDFINKLKREVLDSIPADRQWEGDQERTVRDTIDYLHSQNLIVQDGEVAVPKAPSEKQIDAALEYCDGYNSKYFMGLYKAMITAVKRG